MQADVVRGALARYLERHAAADLRGVLDLFAPTATLEDPVGSPPLEGAEAIERFFAQTHARQGRLDLDPVGPVIVGGREATVHVRAGRTGADASARRVDVVYVATVGDDGRFTSLRAFFEW